MPRLNILWFCIVLYCWPQRSIISQFPKTSSPVSAPIPPLPAPIPHLHHHHHLPISTRHSPQPLPHFRGAVSERITLPGEEPVIVQIWAISKTIHHPYIRVRSLCAIKPTPRQHVYTGYFPSFIVSWNDTHFKSGKIQTLSVTFTLRTSLKDVRGHSNRTSGDIPTGCPAMLYLCIFTWYFCPLRIYMNSE